MLTNIAKIVENSQSGANISVTAVIIIVLTVIICMLLIYLIKKGVFSAIARFIHLTRNAAKKHTREFNQAIGFTGFEYDASKDMFYGGMDAWQGRYGYCALYDEAAAVFGMIIDCEPIRFDYNGKKWLIEFWKGQYGMALGFEVGIYNTTAKKDGPNLMYKRAADEERLRIYTVLKKDGQPLFYRNEVHWWLTGFKLGEFAEPRQLSMDIEIRFKDTEMRRAFVDALKQAGYGAGEYFTYGNTVSVSFARPHMPQPLTRIWLTDRITQWRNRLLCRIYQKALAKNHTEIKSTDELKLISPKLYKKVQRRYRPQNRYAAFYDESRRG